MKAPAIINGSDTVIVGVSEESGGVPSRWAPPCCAASSTKEGGHDSEPFTGARARPSSALHNGFREVLDARGSARTSSQQLVTLVGCLERWLQRKGLGIGSLDDQTLQLFLDDLKTEMSWLHQIPASFTLHLAYLRGVGAVPRRVVTTEPEGRVAFLLDGFRHYLSADRVWPPRGFGRCPGHLDEVRDLGCPGTPAPSYCRDVTATRRRFVVRMRTSTAASQPSQHGPLCQGRRYPFPCKLWRCHGPVAHHELRRD